MIIGKTRVSVCLLGTATTGRSFSVEHSVKNNVQNIRHETRDVMNITLCRETVSRVLRGWGNLREEKNGNLNVHTRSYFPLELFFRLPIALHVWKEKDLMTPKTNAV